MSNDGKVSSSATFNTPIPREVLARISFMVTQYGYRNRADFLTAATNALSEKHGLKPLSTPATKEFRPYTADHLKA